MLVNIRSDAVYSFCDRDASGNHRPFLLHHWISASTTSRSSFRKTSIARSRADISMQNSCFTHCFNFLSEIPHIPISELSASACDCSIRHAPYSSSWQLGEIENRPIKLACGHAIGLSCLSSWISSLNFDNHCPFCRVKIMPKSAEEPTQTALTVLRASAGIVHDWKPYPVDQIALTGANASKVHIRTSDAQLARTEIAMISIGLSCFLTSTWSRCPRWWKPRDISERP